MMYTPLGTLYWRALARVKRRAVACRAGLMAGDTTGARTPSRAQEELLLRQAVRTCNAIAYIYIGGR